MIKKRLLWGKVSCLGLGGEIIPRTFVLIQRTFSVIPRVLRFIPQTITLIPRVSTIIPRTSFYRVEKGNFSKTKKHPPQKR